MHFLILHFGGYPTLLRIWLPRPGPDIVAVSHIAGICVTDARDAKIEGRGGSVVLCVRLESGSEENTLCVLRGNDQGRREVNTLYITITNNPSASANCNRQVNCLVVNRGQLFSWREDGRGALRKGWRPLRRDEAKLTNACETLLRALLRWAHLQLAPSSSTCRTTSASSSFRSPKKMHASVTSFLLGVHIHAQGARNTWPMTRIMATSRKRSSASIPTRISSCPSSGMAVGIIVEISR